MTVIAALEVDADEKTGKPAGVWVCCDACIGGEDWVDKLDRPKWSRHGPILVATSGDTRTGQVVESVRPKRRRKSEADDQAYLIRALLEPAAKMVKDLVVESEASDVGDKKERDFNALLVYRGCVYLVDLSFGIHRSAYRYNAIGAGAQAALGSLASTEGDPCKRIEKAVDAACRHCPSVKGRFPALFVPA